MDIWGYKYPCLWHSKAIPRKSKPRAFWKKGGRPGKRDLHPEEQSSAAKGRRRRRRGGARDCSSAGPEGDPAESMVFGSERSSRDGSCPRRHRTLSVPLPPTSQEIPPPPTSQGLPPAPTSQELPFPLTLQQIAPSSSPQGSLATSTSSVAGPSAPSAPSWGRGIGRRGPTREVTERRLPDGQQWNVSVVRGYGVGPTADHFTSRMGVVSKMYCKIRQKDFAKLPVATQELILRDLQSLDDAIASVPTCVDSSDWQTMCEMWTTGDERSNMHGRTMHRLEVFKMGRCKDLPDGSESWVDEESRRRYEAMIQMIAPSSDVDADSHTTATPEDAFISVKGKDRPGHVRCVGSGETLSTWYGATGTSACLERERIMQEQLKVQ
ncbi:hypothetical protein Taro_044759 [Colocasia esculenta]|uniref:Uncharacterized protein n=1 Tax=Colocasia esculenta TaxID=4460 RepID=A0A843WPH9_COLES|nr:hypothetical protein [Colocasia esculenta]